MRRRTQVAIDCSDPERLAEFWADVLAYRVADPPDNHATWAAFSAVEASQPSERWCVIVDPDRDGPSLLFHSVPEPKQGKNRLHFDVWVEQPDPSVDRRTLVEAEVERLQAFGATRIRTRDDDGDFYIVMHDPEGNEFCIA
jgi:catechol 2,3-dioxygenase-like lactoylglutathione lyase family enzyme